MRVVTLCGTRPELIKLAPLIPLLDARFDHHYVFTGQHFSPLMVQVFLDELKARAPDHQLAVKHSDPDRLYDAVEASLREIAPEVDVVYGDTNSTLAGGRAAAALGCTLIHVEAGIRSFDEAMPEERTRVEVDRLADLRLAPTGLAAWYLTHLEGYDPRTCPAVGNLVVDAWVRHRDLIAARPLPVPLEDLGGPFAVLTLHRPATVDDPAVLARLLRELGEVSMPILFPVHPRTAAHVHDFGLRWPDNLRVCEPLGYLDFCQATSRASVLLTDSGGIQEESVVLHRPCVTLRPNTERMETVLLGTNRLFDPARDEGLAEVVRDCVAGGYVPHRDADLFGRGQTAERITFLLEHLAGGRPVTTFDDEPGIADATTLALAADAVAQGRKP
jgi:UDP-N-acetylglucosamine 2-epimerase (non-hydrolysing)